jgi:hypothetical protein
MKKHEHDKDVDITKAIASHISALNKHSKLLKKVDKSIIKLNRSLDENTIPPETPPNWKPRKITRELDLTQEPDA